MTPWLTDGDVCTLLVLKVALRQVGTPWAGDDQTQTPSTTPTGAASLSNDMLGASAPERN
jgi:hypothetical protein